MAGKRKAPPRNGGKNKKIQLHEEKSAEAAAEAATNKNTKMAAQNLNRADMIKMLQDLLQQQGDSIGPEIITYVEVPKTTSDIVQDIAEDPLVDSQPTTVIPAPVAPVAKFEAETYELVTDNDDNEKVTHTVDVAVADDNPGGNVALVVPINFDEIQIDFQDASTEATVPACDADQDQHTVPKPDENHDEPTVSTRDENQDEPTSPRPPDWKAKCEQLEKQNNNLTAELKKTRIKLKQANADKLSSDNYALRISKELQQVKDGQKLPRAKFTTADGIPITVEKLQEYNERATSDSMFVGLLTIHLVGAENLPSMSVTGQPSHRFAKKKNTDGSPKYPASEKINPKVLDFICNKVAERTAIRVGAENVLIIRKAAEEKAIKRYIATKISNMRKSTKLQGIETQMNNAEQ